MALLSFVESAPRSLSAQGGQRRFSYFNIVRDNSFGGSGTTLIAAEKTRRRAALIELDPYYVDTIVRRWQVFTGAEAIDAATGIRFFAREQALASS